MNSIVDTLFPPVEYKPSPSSSHASKRRAHYMPDGHADDYRNTLRARIFETLDDPTYSPLAWWYSILMLTVILLATICYVLESEVTYVGGILHGSSVGETFDNIELYSIIFFTVEYVVRFACCKWSDYGLFRFIFEPSNLVDVVAFLPYWILKATVSNNNGASGLGFVRSIRLIRVFRVIKFSKYSVGIQMFAGAIWRSFHPISILLFTVSIAVIILGSIMYLVEGEIANVNSTSYDPELLSRAGLTEEGQLFCFGTIARSFWWAVVTMTTVGYGDCYPITMIGKLMAMGTMFAGVLILALPITVVGSNFQKMVDVFQEDTMIYSSYDTNSDTYIDEDELRYFLGTKRRERTLRKGIDLTPMTLIMKFDQTAKGRLNFDEFAELKDYVTDPEAADPNAAMRNLVKKHEQLEQQLDRIESLLRTLTGSGTEPTAMSSSLELPRPETVEPDVNPS